jgi:hypothetical protein
VRFTRNEAFPHLWGGVEGLTVVVEEPRGVAEDIDPTELTLGRVHTGSH